MTQHARHPDLSQMTAFRRVDLPADADASAWCRTHLLPQLRLERPLLVEEVEQLRGVAARQLRGAGLRARLQQYDYHMCAFGLSVHNRKRQEQGSLSLSWCNCISRCMPVDAQHSPPGKPGAAGCVAACKHVHAL